MKKKIINVDKTPVISFSGRMAYGKDFFADLIQKKYRNTKKISFADSLREEVSEIINNIKLNNNPRYVSKKISANFEDVVNFYSIWYQSNENIDTFDVYKKTPVVRELLQFWGTNVRRKQDENYWVDKTIEKIKKLNSEKICPILTDARFPNEVDAINKLNGLSVKINISEEEQIRRLLQRDGYVPSKEALNHSSETALDNYKNFKVSINPEIFGNEITLEILKENIFEKD